MQELKEKLRQAQQNFDYADENYIDAAIHELKAAEEKFRAMLREKRREKKYERIAKRVQPDNKHFEGKQCVDEYYTTKTIFD